MTNPADVSLLEGIATTRSIRRYRDEPVTDEQLATICFAATRAPSGSNRQPFRLIVLRDTPVAREAKALVASAARALWEHKRSTDAYDEGSGRAADSPKARMAAAMQAHVDGLADAPVMVLPCLVRYRAPDPSEGASVFPACQNLLLAARAIGLGGVLTQWHRPVEAELRALLGVPEGVAMAATITLGRPAGNHGPVRRRPIRELVFEDVWDQQAPWAVDPPGTRFTQAGPPSAPRGDGDNLR